MRYTLANEVLRELPFERQCALVAALGYVGLEVAPFTLDESPHLLPAARRVELRRAAADAGIAITGLHWLLVTPKGLSITSRDAAKREETWSVMERLIALAADLGATYLVHGSPNQRRLEEGFEDEGRKYAAEMFARAGAAAAKAGLTYCIEPLAAEEANLLTSVGEAVKLVEAIGNPALRTMIDCAAATRGGDDDPVALIEKFLPTGAVAHIHFNDTSRRAPGAGALAFRPILAALKRQNYAGFVGVEPFHYEPDGPTTAARAIGYLMGCAEGL